MEKKHQIRIDGMLKNVDSAELINILKNKDISLNPGWIDLTDEIRAALISQLQEELLEDLFEKLKSDSVELSDDLPVWGDAPNCTLEVWSWSPTRIIVGSCKEDLQIEAKI